MVAPVRSTAAVLLVLLALLLAACGAPQAAQQSQPAVQTAAQSPTEGGTVAAAQTGGAAQVKAGAVTVKVAVLPIFSYAPFFIAQEQGFFTEQGLKVQLVMLAGQADILPALVSGQVDVGAGLISAGILTTIAKDSRFQIVADKGYAAANGCDSYALVVRRSLVQAGVLQHTEQLRGGSISFPRTSWLNYYAEKTLNKAGLKIEDLRQNELTAAVQLGALNTGQIDLVGNNEPWITRFTQAGHSTIFTPAHELLPDSQSSVTLYGPALVGKNAEVGKRFMIAYLKAVRQYNEGRTERNTAIMSKAVKLDPPLLKQMCWQPLRLDGRINVQSILDFQNWALGKKFMRQAVTPEQFWNSAFVDYANKQLGAVGK
ncbi:MAG: ABC transporter substrate-binding protein [Herpetosiphonaceae bacterium]|nr:ABC transporter substrate-binding protein [Herpetosiphonaceae bacterium]